jgi:hypothetical protein
MKPILFILFILSMLDPPAAVNPFDSVSPETRSCHSLGFSQSTAASPLSRDGSGDSWGRQLGRLKSAKSSINIGLGTVVRLQPPESYPLNVLKTSVTVCLGWAGDRPHLPD